MNESNNEELSYETFNNASTEVNSSADNILQSVIKHKGTRKYSKSSWVWNKVAGETLPEINRQSFDRLHINCLLEFRQSFAFWGFRQSTEFRQVTH